MFLAQDHSVKSQALLERIGLGSYTTGLDGSQCAPGLGRENLTTHYSGRRCGKGSANYECEHHTVNVPLRVIP